jgi:hypothetical protein
MIGLALFVGAWVGVATSGYKGRPREKHFVGFFVGLIFFLVWLAAQSK